MSPYSTRRNSTDFNNKAEVKKECKEIIIQYISSQQTDSVNLREFVETHVELIQRVKDTMLDYQIFIRRLFQTIAEEHQKAVSEQKIRWIKLLSHGNQKTSPTTVITATCRSVAYVDSLGDLVVPSPSNPIMCGSVDVEQCFHEYKSNALELLKAGDIMFDVEDLLALDHVFYLKTINKTGKLMKNSFENQVLSSFRCEQEELYKSIKNTFPGDLRVEVEEALDEFAKEEDLWTTSKRIAAISQKAPCFDTYSIIKFANNLIDNVTATDVGVSENRLTCSFVHDAMKAIFKHDVYTLPHMSNHANDEGAWRPDYKVARLNSAGRAQNICFGEAKKDKDVIKVAKYTKEAIYKFNYNFMLSYVVQDGEVRFFLTKYISKTMFVFFEIEKFQIPTTTTTAISITSIFNKLLRLRILSKSSKANTISSEPLPSLSHALINKYF
ncbi:hypothetical protein BD560DRAFT_388581 [Blakeslea trispora]|nr:hypothetical protein BD560DRAFT_388581 [Blakeslea trispora]